MNCLTNNKNKRGFSLIELMVVVAIMGILASIGIPQYMQYRRTATYAALESRLSTVERAVVTCMAAKGWNQCNSIGPNAVAIANPGNSAWGAVSPNICAQFDEEVGGSMFIACVQVNAITGTALRTFNKRTCFTQARVATADDGNCECACTPGYDRGNVTATQVSGMTCSSQTIAHCDTFCGDTLTTTPCDDVGGTNEDEYCQALENSSTAMCGAAGNTGVCTSATGLCG